MGAGLASGNTVDTLSANAIATGCKRYILITTLAPVWGGISIQRVRWHLPCAAPPPWACGTIRHLAGDRRAAGGLGCPCDVRSRDLANVDHDAPYRSSALDPGIHYNFWIIICHFLCLEFMSKSGATVCSALYCRCVLYTAPTSFTNPAVTATREFSDSFADIYTGQIAMVFGMQIIAVGMADFVKPAW